MASRFKNGSLKRVSRKNGKAWVLRVIATDPATGKKVERTPLFIGYVCDLPTKSAARDRAQELKLHEKINRPDACGRATFGFIARHWLDNEILNPTSFRPKAHTTVYCYKHIVDAYLLPRWESYVAEKLEPVDIEKWFASLSIDVKGPEGLQWDTLSKVRNVMSLIYAHAQRVKLIDADIKHNPLRPRELGGARCQTGSDYEAIILQPAQTFAIFVALPLLQQTMVLLDAATGLRASEIAGLQWWDIDWENNQIHIRRTWINGVIGRPKSKKSKAPVPMSPMLALYLRAWLKQTSYANSTDWVFASDKAKGRSPRTSNMLGRDYLYPAAAKAGLFVAEVVQVKRTVRGKVKDVDHFIYKDKEGRQVTRFGFHNFRHSLSSFLTTKKKTDPKTAQRMLRQSNAAFTLNRYTQTDMDELVAAQQMMLDAIFVDQPKAGEFGAQDEVGCVVG